MEHRHGTCLLSIMHGAHQEIWVPSLLYASEIEVYLILSSVWLAVGRVGVYRPQLYARAACRPTRHYFEVHQLRRLSISMRSAYESEPPKRVKCMSHVLAAVALSTSFMQTILLVATSIRSLSIWSSLLAQGLYGALLTVTGGSE